MFYYSAFKNGLKLIIYKFSEFIKKLSVIAFLYGLLMIIPISVSLLIFWGVSHIPGITPAISRHVFKIIATAGQIIPVSIYLYVSENELKQTNEGSPELCFAFCATVITLIWTCI